MRLAFCIFKYFPFGGLQRDFLRIAQLCLAHGHQVQVYTMGWEGLIPEGLKVTIIPSHGWSNHARCRSFITAVRQRLAHEQYDRVIGFNKMPGLDIYYAGDVCYVAKVYQQRSFLYRLTSRYRQYRAFEQAVFDPQSKTKVLLLTEAQQQDFTHYYGTPAERFYLLPPGIPKSAMAPDNAADIRHALRSEYHIKGDDYLLLMVGSGFKTKGLDRALQAIHSLPNALQTKIHFFVIGHDKAKPFQKLAQRLGIASRIKFLGGRFDVQRFLLSADLLLHPAYSETAGMVLLEALMAGLPILATEVCGYSHHVAKAGAGILLATPFQQQQMNQMLLEMLTSAQRATWRKNGLTYAARTDLSSMPERAVEIIEQVASC